MSRHVVSCQRSLHTKRSDSAPSLLESGARLVQNVPTRLEYYLERPGSPQTLTRTSRARRNNKPRLLGALRSLQDATDFVLPPLVPRPRELEVPIAQRLQGLRLLLFTYRHGNLSVKTQTLTMSPLARYQSPSRRYGNYWTRWRMGSKYANRRHEVCNRAHSK